MVGALRYPLSSPFWLSVLQSLKSVHSSHPLPVSPSSSRGFRGSSVAGPCRPTVQVPVQLEDETDPVTVQSPVQGPRRTHSTVCAPCRGGIRAAA